MPRCCSSRRSTTAQGGAARPENAAQRQRSVGAGSQAGGRPSQCAGGSALTQAHHAATSGTREECTCRSRTLGLALCRAGLLSRPPHPPDSTTDCAPTLVWPAMPATCGKWAPHCRQSSRSFHHSPTRTPCQVAGSVPSAAGMSVRKGSALEQRMASSLCAGRVRACMCACERV